jgi:hypothetical protein
MPKVAIYIGNVVFSFVCHVLVTWIKHQIFYNIALPPRGCTYWVFQSEIKTFLNSSYIIFTNVSNFSELSCSNILVCDFSHVVANLQHFSSILGPRILEVVSSYFPIVHGLFVISFEPSQMLHN